MSNLFDVSQFDVLFVGDTIIDEYIYVSALGKASKENALAVKHKSVESFLGGVKAAASHARNFCRNVDVHSPGRVVKKTRFVDEVYFRKLFEVHSEELTTFPKPLKTKGYDVVVVTDFGHGVVTQQNIEELTKSDCFLAVCAQTNVANTGFNLITKYPRADYVVIDEPEARLAAADRDSPIETLMRNLGKNFKKFVVTHGKHGAYGLDETGFYHCPALTDKVVDTMGAGDAFFAVTAPMAKIGTMPELLRIGNAAGAVKTQIVGHRKSVTKEAVLERLAAY